MLTVTSLAAVFLMTASPFAILGAGEAVTAALIAGVFSTINTVLNWYIIRQQRKVRNEVTEVKQVTDKVKLRKSDRDTGHPIDMERPERPTKRNGE